MAQSSNKWTDDFILTKRTARSISQSLKMINGDFPPSSKDTFFRLLRAQLLDTLKNKICKCEIILTLNKFLFLTHGQQISVSNNLSIMLHVTVVQSRSTKHVPPRPNWLQFITALILTDPATHSETRSSPTETSCIYRNEQCRFGSEIFDSFYCGNVFLWHSFLKNGQGNTW